VIRGEVCQSEGRLQGTISYRDLPQLRKAISMSVLSQPGSCVIFAGSLQRTIAEYHDGAVT
jgi:hypothetical protein